MPYIFLICRYYKNTIIIGPHIWYKRTDKVLIINTFFESEIFVCRVMISLLFIWIHQ
jgi:hypothetical protein